MDEELTQRQVPQSLEAEQAVLGSICLLYTSPSPRD